ncbi:MAG: ABC transporter permease [Candidatus Ancillula sp.]|nr:ABC transporter permease [Candidatus Ancillula sp.]
MASSEHFVAKVDDGFEVKVDAVDTTTPARSSWGDAWEYLRHRPLFYFSAGLLLLILVVVLFPGLFTGMDPKYCDISKAKLPTSGEHLLGTTLQGCDVYARVIYGAGPSVLIGVLTMLISTILGAVIGAIAGYVGGVLDAILSRVTDIFFAIPFILAAVVVLQMMTNVEGIVKIVFTLSAFGWTSSARMMRGAVLETKEQDFITASRALGLSKFQILVKHIVPNSFAPLIVLATTSLAGYIVAEATLSFLGLGLGSDTVSWGVDISNAQESLVTNPALLLFPSGALAITVLAFIFLGDVIREALDPKARQ